MSFKWKTVEGDSTRIYAPKEEYFAWARQWSFAGKDASKPKDFIFAVSCNIQDQSAEGFMIDVERSQGDNLVYQRANPQSLDVVTCEGLAKKVLNLTE